MYGDETAAVVCETGRYRIVTFRVFRAILVTGQVLAKLCIAILEAIDCLDEFECHVEMFGQCVAANDQLSAVIAAQPAPQRRLRRWYVHVRTVQRRKRHKARDGGAKMGEQRFTDSDEEPVVDVERGEQCFQGCRCCIGSQRKRQVTCGRWYTGQYGWL